MSDYIFIQTYGDHVNPARYGWFGGSVPALLSTTRKFLGRVFSNTMSAMLKTVNFMPMLMVILLMTILCLTIVIDLKTTYKLSCQENRRLMGYVLQTLTVKSQLSCFKECEIIKECKSVNILKEETKRFSCELNTCFKMNCENLEMTSNPYKYYFKTGKFLFELLQW